MLKRPQGFGIRVRHWRLGVVSAGRHVCGGVGVICYLFVSLPNLSQNGERWEVRWPGQRENLRFWKVNLVDLAGISFSTAWAFILGFWTLLQNPYLFTIFIIKTGKDLIESKRKCNDSPSLSFLPSLPHTQHTQHTRIKRESIVHVCNLTTAGLLGLAVCSHENYGFWYNKETPGLGTFL